MSTPPLTLYPARIAPAPDRRSQFLPYPRGVPVEVVRVAVIAPPWVTVPPVAYGGTEAAIDVLCRGLVVRGHEVLLVTTGESSPSSGIERTALFPSPVAGLAASGEPGSEPAVVRTAEIEHAAFGHLRATEWGADVVHDHTIAGPAFGAARQARGFGPPVVTTHHGRFDDSVGAIFIALSRVMPVIALSHAHARDAKAATIAAVIHHGVDTDQYRPAETPPGDSALFVGRISADKGIETAIQAARLAGVPLKIAAKMREAAERAYFDSRIAPLLGDEIEYVGELSRAELVIAMANARCLLNPICWNEPFGLVVIEALACGAPVVTTPRGAMPELVDDGRTGFIRSSPSDLADALRHVGDIDRSACRAAVLERFSMDRVARDHETLYCRQTRREEAKPARRDAS